MLNSTNMTLRAKAFPLKNLRDSGTYWYFYDVNAYRLRLERRQLQQVASGQVLN